MGRSCPRRAGGAAGRRARGHPGVRERSTTSACSCACCPSGSTCGRGRSATRTTASPSTGTRSRPWPSARRSSTRRPAGCRLRRRGGPARAARRAAPRRAAPRHRQGPRRRPLGRRGRGRAWRSRVASVSTPAGTDELGVGSSGNHLLLADTATRRDLGRRRTISRFADAVGDTERNASAVRAHHRRLARDRPGGVELRQGGAGARRSSSRRTPCCGRWKPTSRPSTTPTATWPRRWARRPPPSTSARCRRPTRARSARRSWPDTRPPARPGAGRRLGGAPR